MPKQEISLCCIVALALVNLYSLASTTLCSGRFWTKNTKLLMIKEKIWRAQLGLSINVQFVLGPQNNLSPWKQDSGKKFITKKYFVLFPLQVTKLSWYALFMICSLVYSSLRHFSLSISQLINVSTLRTYC